MALSINEFADKWGKIRRSPSSPHVQEVAIKGECLSDLNVLLRETLIDFCQKNVPAELIGDEIILIDKYLNLPLQ